MPPCRSLLLCAVVMLVVTGAAQQDTADEDAVHTQEDEEYEAPLYHGRPSASLLAVQGMDLVRDMFIHAFDAYTANAYGHDELAPLTCSAVDNFGGLAASLIDALDTLAVLQDPSFATHVTWVCNNVKFDKDIAVSLFETNIRIVGGLLSAHFVIEEDVMRVTGYDGCLLALAVDLAERLLPAFDTPTGLPYGTVNLARGVMEGEVLSTSTATAGTLLLEFIILSAVTGDARFERVARRSAVELFNHRFPSTGLVGSHINISDGTWSIPTSLLGVSVDSYLEYLLKAYVLSGELVYYDMFEALHDSFKHIMRGPEFAIEAAGATATGLRFFHYSLANFYPGVLGLAGYIEAADHMVTAQHALFMRYGGVPEAVGLMHPQPIEGQTSYPLRPEHAESLYVLYRATGDDRYVRMGFEVATAINTRCRVPCGFAAVRDVGLGAKDTDADDTGAAWVNRMDSFFFAETLKYLYLLFDENSIFHGVAAAGSPRLRAAARDGSEMLFGDDDSGGVAPSLDTIAQRNRALHDSLVALAIQEQREDADDRRHNGVEGAGVRYWVFNTEGHLFPVTSEWSKYVRWAKQQHLEEFPTRGALAPLATPRCAALIRLPWV